MLHVHCLCQASPVNSFGDAMQVEALKGLQERIYKQTKIKTNFKKSLKDYLVSAESASSSSFRI